MSREAAEKAYFKVDQAAPFATVDELADYDAIIFGTPTRFGNMAAQMRNFLDQTGGLWAQGKLIGKIGSVFVSTGSQHGGQETTITSFHTTLFHQGMVVVGVPFSHPGLMVLDEVSGGTPYGATTIAGGQGQRSRARTSCRSPGFRASMSRGRGQARSIRTKKNGRMRCTRPVFSLRSTTRRVRGVRRRGASGFGLARRAEISGDARSDGEPVMVPEADADRHTRSIVARSIVAGGAIDHRRSIDRRRCHDDRRSNDHRQADTDTDTSLGRWRR